MRQDLSQELARILGQTVEKKSKSRKTIGKLTRARNSVLYALRKTYTRIAYTFFAELKKTLWTR